MDDDARYRVHDASTGLARLANTTLWWAFPSSARARLMDVSTALFESEDLDDAEPLPQVSDVVSSLLEATTAPPLVRVWRLFRQRQDLRRAAHLLAELDASLQARAPGAIPPIEEGGPRTQRTRIPRQSTARNVNAG